MLIKGLIWSFIPVLVLGLCIDKKNINSLQVKDLNGVEESFCSVMVEASSLPPVDCSQMNVTLTFLRRERPDFSVYMGYREKINAIRLRESLNTVFEYQPSNETHIFMFICMDEVCHLNLTYVSKILENGTQSTNIHLWRSCILEAIPGYQRTIDAVLIQNRTRREEIANNNQTTMEIAENKMASSGLHRTTAAQLPFMGISERKKEDSRTKEHYETPDEESIFKLPYVFLVVLLALIMTCSIWIGIGMCRLRKEHQQYELPPSSHSSSSSSSIADSTTTRDS